MLELPWLKVEKSVNRVEKNLLDVCATLQSQIDKMSCESDNDIDEVSNSISNIANDISTLMGDVSGIKSDIQMLKSGVLSNQEMICDLKRKFDNFSSTLGGGKEMDVTDSYSKVASSNSWLSKTSRAALAKMAKVRTERLDLILYTAIVSLCASGIMYLVMTY